jgi:hypothetical protein
MANIRTGLAWLVAGAATLAGIVSFSFELHLAAETIYPKRVSLWLRPDPAHGKAIE